MLDKLKLKTIKSNAENTLNSIDWLIDDYVELQEDVTSVTRDLRIYVNNLEQALIELSEPTNIEAYADCITAKRDIEELVKYLEEL